MWHLLLSPSQVLFEDREIGMVWVIRTTSARVKLLGIFLSVFQIYSGHFFLLRVSLALPLRRSDTRIWTAKNKSLEAHENPLYLLAHSTNSSMIQSRDASGCCTDLCTCVSMDEKNCLTIYVVLIHFGDERGSWFSSIVTRVFIIKIRNIHRLGEPLLSIDAHLML